MITEKSTKQVIMAAYEKAAARLAEIEGGKLDVDTQAKSKKVEKAQQNVGHDPTDVVVRIEEIRRDANKSFNILREECETSVQLFNDLRVIVEEKSAEVQELYGLEAKAGALAALVETYQETQRNLDTEIEQIRQQHHDERANLERQTTAANARLQAQMEADTTAWQTTCKRRTDEWEYNFRKTCRDAGDAELAKRLAESKVLDGRKESLLKEEEALRGAQAELEQLRKANDEFEAVMQLAVDQAVKEANSRAEARAGAALTNQATKLEAQLAIAADRLTHESARVSELTTRVKEVEEQLREAYQKINDQAAKALDTSHMQNAMGKFQQMFSETNATSKRPGNSGS